MDSEVLPAKVLFVERMRALEVPLYYAAKAFFRSDADCADAMKESVLRAYRSGIHSQDDAVFKKAIVLILVKACKKKLRSRRNEIVLSSEAPGFDFVNDSWIEPLSALEDSLREAVLLRHYGGLSVQEIAVALRVSSGAVESRLQRANEIMGDKLSAFIENPEPVPSSVRDGMEAVYEALPDRSFAWTFRNKTIWLGAGALAVIAAIVLCFVSPAVRSIVVPEAAAGLGEAAEVQGIAIKLEQASYDGSKLLVVLSHDKDLLFQLGGSDEYIRINGKPLYVEFGQSTDKSKDDTTSSIYLFDLKAPLPETFTLDVRLREAVAFGDGQGKTIEGNWIFRTNVTQIKEGVIKKQFDPPLTKESGEIRIALTGLSISPFATEVNLDVIKPSDYDFIKIRRDLEVGEKAERHMLWYELWNEEGSPVASRGMSGHGIPGELEQYVVKYFPISADSKTLTLRVIDETAIFKKLANGSLTVIDSKTRTIDELEIEIPLDRTIDSAP